MKTLVYFASGCYRPEYQKLDFDRIFLIDNCFKNSTRYHKNIFDKGKVTCVGMDCLESIEFLKREKVKIDYFVSLNEGLFEGGGSYAINSDMFLGYVMPLLKDTYIHIMNKDYYKNIKNIYNVSMDLPFYKEEIPKNDNRYLDPFIFSKYDFITKDTKVYQMTRIENTITPVNINTKIKTLIIHDSIWNYYNSLDYLVLSFSEQGQRDFFTRKFANTIDINHSSIKAIFKKCVDERIAKIGFTPWAKGNYGNFINFLQNYDEEYPKELHLFHLNKKDYQQIKEFNDKI